MRRITLPVMIGLVTWSFIFFSACPFPAAAADKRLMILAVPISQWAWSEPVLDPETEEPTGRYTIEYGEFWTFVHENIDPAVITPEFKRLIDTRPKQMLKDGVPWGIIIMPVSRFAIDYDTWSTGMKAAMTEAEVTYLSITCDRAERAGWFADNGFTEIGGAE